MKVKARTGTTYMQLYGHALQISGIVSTLEDETKAAI